MIEILVALDFRMQATRAMGSDHLDFESKRPITQNVIAVTACRVD